MIEVVVEVTEGGDFNGREGRGVVLLGLEECASFCVGEGGPVSSG